MRKFTAGYCNSNLNFIIANLTSEKDFVSQLQDEIYILKNILMRGHPTLPSKYLRNKLGDFFTSNDFKQEINFSSSKPMPWYNTIKGGEDGYNPAKRFYFDILSKSLTDLDYIYGQILPEATFESMIEDCPDRFKHQQVDFYCPTAKLVIEIDGMQHSSAMQSSLDRDRNYLLKTHNIDTIRISTQEIESQSYGPKITAIVEAIKAQESGFQSFYLGSKHVKADLVDDNIRNDRLLPMAIMRLEIAFLELLLIGKLDLNADIDLVIACDENWCAKKNKHANSIKDFASLAFEDVFIYLDKLHRLRYKEELSKPEFKVSYITSLPEDRARDKIYIDLKLYENYGDEHILNSDVVYIRNDYFSIEDCNYFRVSSSSSIDYRIDEEDRDTLRFFLQNIFDKKDFRDGQFAIIANALNLRDTIGLLPTGGGKSLCYQLPCLLQPSINFVVSPIKSLMYDQVDNLNLVAINNVSVITSDFSAKEKERLVSDYGKGKSLIIYVSPERFQVQGFRETIASIVAKREITYAVIDEVHCLSEWGHDFRTSYLNLAKTIDKLSHKGEDGEGVIKFLGLTATASVNVLKDIKIEFSRQKYALLDRDIKTLVDYSRPELNFEVKNNCGKKLDYLYKIIDDTERETGFLRKKDKALLIFTPYVNGPYGCHGLASTLRARYGFDKVGWYSGSIPKKFEQNIELEDAQHLEPEEAFNIYKQESQKQFKDNVFPIMVATKAFGMGIDKTNIFYTVHYGISSSVEALYQEAGRAGRWDKSVAENADLKAYCYVLASREILEKDQYDFIFNKDTTISKIRDLLTAQKFNVGDVLRQFLLYVNNNQDIKEEYIDICKVTQYLFSLYKANQEKFIVLNIRTIYSKFRITNALLEKIIYRLSLCGIIKDWTNDFVSSYVVEIGSFKEADIIESLSEYIKKYDNLVNIDYELDSIINENTKLNRTSAAIFYLSTWIYENINYSRRQSLKTLFDWCEQYDGSENFKKRLESYFTFNDLSIVLQNMADDQRQIMLFTKVIDPKNLPNKKEVESLIDMLSRYLESYRNNICLDLISGLLRLLNNDYENIDGRVRLDSSLKKMLLNLDKETINAVFMVLLNITRKMADDENYRERALELALTLQQHFKAEKDFILEQTQLYELSYIDFVSQSQTIKNIKRKLNELIEGF